MKVSDALHSLPSRFSGSSETPGLDAQVLVAHVLGRGRAWVLAHPEAELDAMQQAQLLAEAARLESGIPLPYVIGHWEFFGLDFLVSPAVLIPRPETELLVEWALSWLGAHPRHRRVIDVGTGSGCISVALAARHPDLHVLAVDLSFAALQVARANVQRHGLSGRVQLVQADLLPPTTAPFDLICANLPYIPRDTLYNLKVYRSEPSLALDGGPEGLDAVQGLLSRAPARLAPGGALALEIESSQGAAARRLALQAFPQADVQVLPDLSGRERLLTICTGG